MATSGLVGAAWLAVLLVLKGDLGVKVWFRVWGLGFGFGIWGLGFRVQGLGFGVWG